MSSTSRTSPWNEMTHKSWKKIGDLLRKWRLQLYLLRRYVNLMIGDSSLGMGGFLIDFLPYHMILSSSTEDKPKTVHSIWSEPWPLWWQQLKLQDVVCHVPCFNVSPTSSTAKSQRIFRQQQTHIWSYMHRPYVISEQKKKKSAYSLKIDALLHLRSKENNPISKQTKTHRGSLRRRSTGTGGGWSTVPRSLDRMDGFVLVASRVGSEKRPWTNPMSFWNIIQSLVSVRKNNNTGSRNELMCRDWDEDRDFGRCILRSWTQTMGSALVYVISS